ncbi:hypothetical protein [Synechococcus sp. WH 8101]|nr:hypothetical protein [Synechococcus sp. WH 8101]
MPEWLATMDTQSVGCPSMEFALLAGVVTAAVSFCALWDQKVSR